MDSGRVVATENPRKIDGKPILTYFWVFFGIFGQILRFLINIKSFLSFSNKNHAESSMNFVKIPFLDPKHAKLEQTSDFGHVRTCPGGQVLTADQRKYSYFSDYIKKINLFNKTDDVIKSDKFT